MAHALLAVSQGNAKMLQLGPYLKATITTKIKTETQETKVGYLRAKDRISTKEHLTPQQR